MWVCRGSFAVVKRATCRKDGSEWAVKCIDKGKLQKEDEDALKVEVEILEKVRRFNTHGRRTLSLCLEFHSFLTPSYLVMPHVHPHG